MCAQEHRFPACTLQLLDFHSQTSYTCPVFPAVKDCFELEYTLGMLLQRCLRPGFPRKRVLLDIARYAIVSVTPGYLILTTFFLFPLSCRCLPAYFATPLRRLSTAKMTTQTSAQLAMSSSTATHCPLAMSVAQFALKLPASVPSLMTKPALSLK
jgi:hypothetical protein